MLLLVLVVVFYFEEELTHFWRVKIRNVTVHVYMWFFGKPLPNEEVIKVNVEFMKFMPACNIPDGSYIIFD